MTTELPRALEENVGSLIDNFNNFQRRQEGQKSGFCDDCGSWCNGASPKTLYAMDNTNLKLVFRDKDCGLFCTKKMVKKQCKLSPLNPQTTDGIEVQQNYCTLTRSSSKYARKITCINPSEGQTFPSVAFPEYAGTFPEEAFHGNSKDESSVHMFTLPQVSSSR